MPEASGCCWKTYKVVKTKNDKAYVLTGSCLSFSPLWRSLPGEFYLGFLCSLHWSIMSPEIANPIYIFLSLLKEACFRPQCEHENQFVGVLLHNTFCGTVPVKGNDLREREVPQKLPVWYSLLWARIEPKLKSKWTTLAWFWHVFKN